MDAQHEAYAATLDVNHFKPEEVPWRRLGQCEYFHSFATQNPFACAARMLKVQSDLEYQISGGRSKMVPIRSTGLP